MQGVSLYEQQALFAHALRHGNATLDTQALLCGDAPRRAAGMAAYRRNHDAALCAALRAAYPLVCAIVGDDFFDTAARHYDDAYPGACGDLHLRGAHVAAFLRAYAPAAALPYLPDVAALDWALHCADSAADATPLSAAQFAAQLQHSPAHLRLRLQPAAALLRSAFPLYDIWRFHQPGGDGQPPDWAQAQCVLVWRPQWQPQVRALHAAEAAALDVALAGGTLEAALAAALGVDGSTDLQAMLTRWLAGGLVAQLTLDPLESLSSFDHFLGAPPA